MVIFERVGKYDLEVRTFNVIAYRQPWAIGYDTQAKLCDFKDF